MFQSILIAIDGSKFALKAGLQAAKYPFCKGAKITLISAFDPSMLTYGGVLALSREQTDELRDSVRNRVLTPALEAFKNEGFEVTAKMIEGVPDDCILEEAKRNNCDLIVVGRRGLGRLKRWFAGSISLSVARKSSCPVLVIPEQDNAETQTITKIVSPTDFSQTARLGCKAAVDICKEFEFQLFVCHSIIGWDMFPGGQPDVPFFDEAIAILKTELRNKLENEVDKIAPQSLKARAVLSEGEADVGVLRAVEDLQADMLVLSSHGRRGLNRWLIGSVAEKILKSSTKPILLWKKLDSIEIDT